MSQTTLFEEPQEKPARRTRAPKELNPRQRKRLEEWAERTVPWLRRAALDSFETLDSYVEETLEFWHANGKLKADWVATIENRIRQGERPRLKSLAMRGNEEAAFALRDPIAWAQRFDRRARSRPKTVSPSNSIFRPSGGNVIHLKA